MDLFPREWLMNWLLVFLRATAMLSIFPMFSTRNVPVQLRVALGAFTALLLAPGLTAAATPVDFWGLVGLMVMEVGVGVLLGYICRLVFFALEVAGGIVGTEMGLSMPASIDAGSGQTSAPGATLYYLAIVLWLGLDLHHWLLAAFQRTYTLLPPGGARLSEVVLTQVLDRCIQLFALALQIAAPVLAVSFLISLVFSVLGRAVPQMNVFAESFAVRILAGLTVFGMTCQLMAQHILNYLNRLPEDMLRVARALAV